MKNISILLSCVIYTIDTEAKVMCINRNNDMVNYGCFTILIAAAQLWAAIKGVFSSSKKNVDCVPQGKLK